MLRPSSVRHLQRVGVSALCLFGSLVACDPAAQNQGATGSAGPSGASSASAAAPAEAAPARADLAREGQTIALAPRGDRLVVADEDHQALVTAPLPLGGNPTKLDLPGRPAQVLWLATEPGGPETLLVTIREVAGGGGALLLLEPEGESWRERARATLPSDAWGVATSPDGRFAAVTSAWPAKLSLVELSSARVVWTRDVPREPRGALFTDADTLFVSHLVGSDVTRVQGLHTEPQVSAVALPAAPLRSPAAEKLTASLGYALVATPARDRLFFPRHALGAIGIDSWFGTPTVDALDVVGPTPVATARQVNAHAAFIGPVAKSLEDPKSFNFWNVRSEVVPVERTLFVQPRAAVFRKNEQSLLIVSEGDNALVELDAAFSDPALAVRRWYPLGGDVEKEKLTDACGAPSGLALAADETVAYVHCRTTDRIVAVLLPEGPDEWRPPPNKRFVELAARPADASYAAGRRLFYDANDGYVSGGMGCAGCHPEGRDDGFVWHEVELRSKGSTVSFTNFFGSASAARFTAAFWAHQEIEPVNADADGVGVPRQTPMIVGRLKAKGPYGWLAESDTLEARLLGGFKLHRWSSPNESGVGFTTQRARQLAAFLPTGLVPPPRDPAPLDEEEERGKAVFLSEKAACATCHTPETDYTNRSVAAFAPYRERGFFKESAAYKTPSLLFVGGSPPYFHDGRYRTLDELVEKSGDQMGKTSHLSPDEKKALVAFLRRL